MKLKNYKIKILAMTIAIIALSFLFCKSAFAIQDWKVADSVATEPHPYERNSEEYCGEHNPGDDSYGTLMPKAENATLYNAFIQFDGGTLEDIDPSVGYARYAGYSGAVMQAIIWDHTTNNTGMQQTSATAEATRAKNYKLVYNKIFSKLKDKQSLLTTTTKESDLKVFVDKTSGKYTVGPYNVNLSITGNSDDKEFSSAVTALREELTQKHDSPFAEFTGISGVNGTNIELLDRDGKKINSTIPELGKDFYIRFTPNEEGAIQKTGKPRFGIRYIAGFTGKVTRYRETNVRASISIGAVAQSTSVNTSGIAWEYVTTIPGGTVTQHGSVTVPVEYKATVTSRYFDDKVVSETRSVTVNFERSISFDEYGNVTYVGWAEQKTAIPATLTITRDAETFSGARNLQDIIIISQFNQPTWKESITDLPESVVNMQLGGKVWKDVESGPKTTELNGRKDEDEEWFAGIEVSLYEAKGNKLVATTTTDKNGVYRFFGHDKDGRLIVNPLKDYYVIFRYNGQIYESTYYKNDLTGGYSNAKDVNRDAFNGEFEAISAYPNNYGENKIAYSWEQKIKDSNGNYIKYGKNEALRFRDVYAKFLEFATNKEFKEATKNDATTQWNYANSYSSMDKLEKWLKDQKVADSEIIAIKTFISDTLMSATTNVGKVKYSVYDKFVLENIDKNSDDYKKTKTPTKKLGSDTYTYIYSKNSDQARNVDFGLHERVKTNLAIQKDIYKATVIVNGKKEDYIYNKKALNDAGVWTVNVRASDYNYNPSAVYDRPVKESDYLYNGDNDRANADLRKIKMYVTYRITVRNVGSTKAVITGIKDYFDPAQYAHDRNDVLVNEGTYSGMQNCSVDDIWQELEAKNRGNIITKQGESDVSGACLYITGLENTTLDTNHFSTVYVTFKVNNGKDGKMQLGGKKNIVEINGYKTYYDNNQTIPDSLDKSNNKKDTKVANKPAGLIDKNSNPGNLSTKDLKDGIIISDKDKPWVDREEDDTDQAPTLDVHLDNDPDGEHTRKFKGYVYEDKRTVGSAEAKVGDGQFNDGETKINGVTLELVELVQEIDPKTGIATGNYLGEYPWVEGKGDDNDYYSGLKTPKTVIQDNVSKIDTLGDGEYEFRSIVAGDYYIRFKYGDTSRTVLKNDDNDVNKKIGIKGMNATSYNGQDYKSTVYQKGIDQNAIPAYKGIKGYTDYEKQNVANYSQDSVTKYVQDHYYAYDIAVADAGTSGISDAKDIYSYREACNTWSKGADKETLLNKRAEELASFEKLLTGEVTEAQQKAAITEMMANTHMVAQTGVINGEIEYNRTVTEDKGDEKIYNYTVNDIDLGLVERAKAALTLNKEVENITITNGDTVLFDTSKSVKNFAFTDHMPHDVIFNERLIQDVRINEYNGKKSLEILQLSVDDELITGANLKIRYAFKVTNKGEVDYTDKQFYYTGITENPKNIVTTNAKKIIDYPTNELKFLPGDQTSASTWKVDTWQGIVNESSDTNVDTNYVNSAYKDTLKTYNLLLTSEALQGDLTPEQAEGGDHATEAKLTLSTSVASEHSSLVYNNLAEIIATSNSVGRRNAYSIAGNQRMADQSLGDDAAGGHASTDRIIPDEIDADSAQLFKMVPPTGSDINYLLLISGLILATGLILTSGILIKKGNTKLKAQ